VPGGGVEPPRPEGRRIQRAKLFRPTFDLSLISIESLELAIKANPKVIQRFKTFNNKRNKSVYDVAGAVSDQELEAMIKLANELKDSTLAWLQEFHPQLIKI